VNAISYLRTDSVASALGAAQAHPSALFLAGGTTVVDLLREGVFTPDVVVDIGPLPLSEINVGRDFTRIGAMVPNSELAWNPAIRTLHAAVSEALLSGASGQIRNMATTGGNLLQRTRCPYYRNLGAACNKRAPGSGCAALEGFNRSHAVLGGSPHCIATNPSDLAVALTALEAQVVVADASGERTIPLAEFYLEPGATPDKETVLAPGDLIVAVLLPHPEHRQRSHYLKVRDRSSFEFALASAAVAARDEAGVLRDVRVALGGVGTRPWRAREAEEALEGKPPGEAAFAAAGEAAMEGAQPRRHNAFKVPLAKATLVAALRTLTGST
jgi:xanthine dehydrogenase YagS FAD-binding subunit